MPNDFDTRVVLVTGAGSGIGREAARAFAERGAVVYCVGRHDRNLTETQDLIVQAGGTAHVARADVSEEQDVAALVARIEAESGRLDVAFNNAGVTGGAHAIEDYPTTDFDRRSASQPEECLPRHEVRVATDEARRRRRDLQHGIGGRTDRTRWNVWIRRLETRRAGADPRSRDGERRSQHSGQCARARVDRDADGRREQRSESHLCDPRARAIPAKRGGEATEVAAAAVWLCSAEASYVFGQMFVVDGGMTIGGFAFS